MNFEKLKDIRRKGRKYGWIAFCFGLPMALALIAIMICLVFGISINVNVLIASVIVGTVFGIVTFIFGCKEERYSDMAEKYIISKIKETIIEYGIDEKNIKIICEERDSIYQIAFHNQIINYDDLRAKLLPVLQNMNKIACKNVRIKLL